MEQMNGSPSSLLPVGVVVVVLASVVFSFVSPWGTVVEVDVVVGLALVTSFVSPSVVGVVVVVQVVLELVETTVPGPLETSCSFVFPCCSWLARLGFLVPCCVFLPVFGLVR